jgi:protein-disulfide isomerase
MSPETPGSNRASRPGRLRVILVLSIGIALLGVAIFSMSTREPSQEFQGVEGTADARRIFGGVRQLGERLGFEDAPVQIQVFTDVQSSGFADWFTEVIPGLVNGPVRSGDVQLLLRNRSFTRNATQLSFYGVEAAKAQDYAWHYAYLMVRNQDLAIEEGLDADFLETIAKSIEFLEVPVWRADYDAGLEPGSEMNASLQEQDTLAIDLRLTAEPAVVVAGDNGTEVLQDAPDLATIQDAVEQVR